MKRELQDIAISMLCNFLNNNISIDVEWIPRSKNDQADFISRIVDYDDWGVSDDPTKLIGSPMITITS
jgi:hypothetical protein